MCLFALSAFHCVSFASVTVCVCVSAALIGAGVLLPSSVAVVVGAAAFVMSIINSTSYEKGWQKNCVRQATFGP